MNFTYVHITDVRSRITKIHPIGVIDHPPISGFCALSHKDASGLIYLFKLIINKEKKELIAQQMSKHKWL